MGATFSGGTERGSKGCGCGMSNRGSDGNDGSDSDGGGPNILDLSVIGPVYAGSSIGTGIGVGKSADGSWNHICWQRAQRTCRPGGRTVPDSRR